MNSNAISSFQFGKTTIGKNAPAFIIAEIGINHEGDLAACMKMVEACAEAGADAVKLQTSDPDENYHPGSLSYDIYKKSFFGADETGKVFDYARELGLETFTTSGLRTLEWVDKLNPSGYKISSGIFSNELLIEKTIEKKRPTIISTGISAYDDIDNIVTLFKNADHKDYAILQCTSLYPCPDEEVHLNVIKSIEEKYQVLSGLSDHTTSIDVPSLAVAAGAKIIEKHFTLDKQREGYDHHISLDEKEFRQMVDLIRRAERLLGNDSKELTPELKTKRVQMARYIHAAQDLTKLDTITIDDLLFLRAQTPNDNLICASDYKKILGKKLATSLLHLDPINKNDVENEY